MAKIKIPKKKLEEIIPLDEKGTEKIASFGTPVESIDEQEVELEVSANRPDLLSTQGLVRALSKFLGKNSRKQEYEIKKSPSKETVLIDKSVKSIRPYTVCAIVKNLDLSGDHIKEIISLQEKLHSSIGRNRKKLAIGVYPLENITFPIRYTALAPKNISFIPLGSSKNMTAEQILEKHPTGKEYAHLLKDYQKYPVFIDAKNKVLSMPPVINSEETGRVNEKTEELFIECSGHNKPALVKTLNILVTALADMGGTIHEIILEDEKRETSPQLSWEKRNLSLDETNKTLGLSLKEKEINASLEKMGYKIESGTVLVPPWRADVLHEIDLIEDVAIGYGYSNLIPTLPQLATIAQEDSFEQFKGKVMDLLIGLGQTQILTPHLITLEESRILKEKSDIYVENAKSEFTILRRTLLAPLFRTLGHNTDTEYPQKIFEIGTVFRKDDGDEIGIRERENLCIGLTPSNVTEAKQTMDYILRMLNLNYTIEDKKEEGFIEGRTATVLIDKEPIGFFGEVHPWMLREWHLKMPLSIISLDLETIFDKAYPK